MSERERKRELDRERERKRQKERVSERERELVPLSLCRVSWLAYTDTYYSNVPFLLNLSH